MNYIFKTKNFSFEYLECEIKNTILRESHCHSQYELIAVSEGNVKVMIEGRLYHLKADQAVIIPPLSYHTVTANKKGVYKRITILFDQSAIPNVLRNELSKDIYTSTVFPTYQISNLKRICKAENPELFIPLAESIMILMMYESMEASPVDSENNVINEVLNQILLYIDNHLSEKITLDDIAIYTARSKSSICHLFQEQMNISPKQYILQKKLALAANLIHNGMPPTAAALRIGYNNYSDFYRIYLKHIQSPPSKYKPSKNSL